MININFTDKEFEEIKKRIKELQEQSRNLYIELYGEPKEVNITKHELKEIRKKVEKALLKTSSEYYDTIADIFNIYHLTEYEEDYEIYGNLSKEEYNEILKLYKEDGRTEKDFERNIKREHKYLNEIKIMKYRFKEKYNWKKISQEVKLSERQCQRIKDKILNDLIISWLREENYITSKCREGYFY